ncbi:hypothetical protein SNE40_018211 [Patella caerulea]|uniref:Endonuclease/exonuclease/phosphatase domain-containing protein n=2 Tax=Patella caerulea TaxID=87958 RepID=A0AAN8PJL9_PATCE
MLNGRVGVQDFTSISTKGKAVVDYVCVPHESLETIKHFNVLTMTDAIADIKLQPTSIPDHSMLIWEIHVDYKLNQRQDDVISPGHSVKRYQLRETPDDFLSFSNIDPLLYEKITAIEGNLQCQKDIQRAYSDFLELIKTEMDNRIPCKKTSALNFDIKKNNRTRKPYWNVELAAQWSHARNCEKMWLKSNSHVNKGKLKSEFCQARKCFDQLHRKVKRQYRQKLQDELTEKFECTNSTEFWKTIGQIGISNYRQNKIPWAVINEEGRLVTDQ